MQSREYLVEICLKDWVPGSDRVIAYEEVLALDEYDARHMAFDQYVERVKFSPITRRKWEQLNLSFTDICAPTCIEL